MRGGQIMATKVGIGLRIQKMLRSCRLNQEGIARVLEIPRTAVSAIENGKRDVTAYELYLLCSLTNTEPNKALCWDEPKVLCGEGE